MELEGRYATLWLSDAGARIFLGLDPSGLGQEYRWLVGGKVLGESPLGLWMKIDALVRPDDTPFAPPADPTLVRWEWIVTATLLAEKPKDYRPSTLKVQTRPD